MFRARTEVCIEVGGATLRASGSPEFVERAIATFLSRMGANAPVRSEPTPMDRRTDEDTDVVRDRSRQRRRRSFIRLHAIDGGIAKVYPLDGRNFGRGLLGRFADVRKVSNLYVESPALSQRLRGTQETIWHALVPPQDR